MTTHTLAEILTLPVATIGPGSQVSHALALMQEPGASAVVVTQDDKPVGIFTERDMVRFAGRWRDPDTVVISDLMSKPPITASPDTDFQEAVDLIERHRIRHLVIVDHTGRLAGVVTEGDLLPYLHRAIDELRDSKSRLAEAQHLACIGTWELDLIDNKLWWSKEVYQIFEVEPSDFDESFLGFLSNVHPEDREPVYLAYTESVAKHTPYEYVHRLLLPDGRIKYVNERGQTDYADDGTPLRSIGTVQDITERKQAAQALAENEARLTSIFRVAPVGIGVLIDRVFMEVNTYFCEMTGFSKEDLIGQNARMIYPSEEEYEYVGREKYKQINKSGTGTVEARIKRKDGAIIDTILSSTPLDSEDLSKGVTFTALDITERRRAEEDVHQALIERDTITATVPDILYMLDKSGRLKWWNRALEILIDWPAKRIATTPAAELFVEEDRPLILQKIQHAFTEGFSEIQASLLTKKGPRTYLFNGRRLEYGNISYLVGSGRDLTERKRMEAALQASESRLRTLVDTLPDLIWLKDPEGIYLLCNKKFERFFGAKEEEIVGKTDFDFVSTELASFFRQKDKEAIAASGSQINEEWVTYAQGGHRELLETIKTPMHDNQNRLVGVLGIARDITERHEAQLRIAQAKDLAERRQSYLQAIFDNLPFLVWLKDEESRFLAVNDVFARSCGAPDTDWLVTKTDLDIWPRELAETYRADDLEVMETGRRKIVEELVAEQNGAKWFETFKAPIFDADGRTIGTTGFAQDITERIRAREGLERRVAERTAELRAANAELEAFTYAVSHDLRAPLRTISGFSQALIEDFGENLDDQASIYLSHLVQASGHMRDLIEGLLRLSHSTRGDLSHEKIDLSALVQQTADRVRDQRSDRQVRLDIEAGVTATADRRLLITAIENLLDNALKYTSNTPEPRIEFFTEQRGNNTVYCMKDNGAGFDMEYIDKLFMPFQRLHHQNEFPGIGIGLATIQRIVHRHGGEIWANSEPGYGAQFCFTLRH